MDFSLWSDSPHIPRSALAFCSALSQDNKTEPLTQLGWFSRIIFSVCSQCQALSSHSVHNKFSIQCPARAARCRAGVCPRDQQRHRRGRGRGRARLGLPGCSSRSPHTTCAHGRRRTLLESINLKH